MASGEFAANFAATTGSGSPFRHGRSRNRGGFFGSGAQAAADARTALVRNPAFATSSNVLTA